MLALVIGNSEYQGISSLTNAGRDAQLISSTLAEIGVDSAITRFDLTRAEMSRTVNEFFRAMSRYDVGFVYYAGHGMQDEYGENYLVPVDFGTESSSDLYSEGFDTERIFRGCSRLRDKAFVFFLDACRNNPYPSDYRSSGSGLGEPEVPSEGVLVGFSTESGKVAGDYAEQSNGHYASALSEMLKVPNMKAEDILKEVGTIVRDKSDRKQSPEWWGNLSGSVIFNFDAAQYEVQLAELQNSLIVKIHEYFDSVDIFKEKWAGRSLPLEFIGLASRLRAFGQEHILRGQLKLARQAHFYALVLDFYIANFQGDVFSDSKQTVDFLNGTDVELLFRENQDSMRIFGIRSDIDLDLYISYCCLRLYPESKYASLFVSRFLNDLWLEDDVTWAVGISSWSFIFPQCKWQEREFHFFPAAHHFKIEGDSIAMWAQKAYPEVSGLSIGTRIKSIIVDGDTVDDLWNGISTPIELVLEGGDGHTVKLEPQPGFVLRNGAFVQSRSREQYLKRYRNATDDLAEVEIKEWHYLYSDSLEHPAFYDLLPMQAMYVSANNWSIGLGECNGFQPEVSETSWAMFRSELRLLEEWEGPYNHVWGALFKRFDASCNELLFQRKDFLKKNWRIIKKELLHGAEYLIQLLEDNDFYCGEVSWDMGSGSETKISLGGTSWALAAAIEEHMKEGENNDQLLLSSANDLVASINKASIDQDTSPSTYLIDLLNYNHLFAEREELEQPSRAIEILTSLLDEVVFVYRPYKSDATIRLIDHPFLKSGRFSLLPTGDSKALVNFFYSFGTWSKIYAPGYYKPVQYAVEIISQANHDGWEVQQRQEVLKSIGPIIENWQASANQYWARERSVDGQTERVQKISSLVELVRNGNEMELEWYDNFQRNHTVFLDLVGVDEK